ncbi:hypothetical protein BGW80DRAFT_1308383 [Lactifluus volemus]|nr:hypothetical protein BGW80DRAFT_1343544 [Lactifluus volemus]KAH9973597.1 hypothetical protein BGW80DRAFT_1308383 [Lactifluus volemus]
MKSLYVLSIQGLFSVAIWSAACFSLLQYDQCVLFMKSLYVLSRASFLHTLFLQDDRELWPFLNHSSGETRHGA